MATGKTYHWFKNTKDFMDGEAVDYLMSLDGGANYIVFYQRLVLACANSNGRFETVIGDVVIPFDDQKLQRIGKWFDAKTIKTAIELLYKLGLIYKDENDVFAISNFEKLIGHETDFAGQKRSQRERNRKKDVDNVHSNVHKNVHTESRVQSQESRDQNSEPIIDNVVVFVSKDGDKQPENDNHEVDEDDVVSYANEHFKLTVKQEERLRKAIRRLNPGLAMCAVDAALDNGAKAFKYVESTLDDYWDKGYETVGDLKAWEKQRSEIKRHNPNFNVSILAPKRKKQTQ